MKTFFSLLTVASAAIALAQGVVVNRASVSATTPVSAIQTKDLTPLAVIVRNQAMTTFDVGALLPALRSQLTATLQQAGFRAVDPSFMMQNPAVAASPAAICQAIGANAMLVASITELRLEPVGAPAKFYRPRATISFTMTGADGIAITNGSGTFSAQARPLTVAQQQQLGIEAFLPIFPSILQTASSDLQLAATHLASQAKAIAKVNVNFSCNVAGANLSIDGMSMGTLAETAVTLAVAQGPHTIEVTSPIAVPYSQHAVFAEGQTFAIVLTPTQDFINQWKDFETFNLTLERIRAAGATDDFARKVVAEGTSEMLSNSHFRWEGAPTKKLYVTPVAGAYAGNVIQFFEDGPCKIEPAAPNPPAQETK